MNKRYDVNEIIFDMTENHADEREIRNKTIGQSIRKRLPWLVTLLFLGMAVSTVVGAFEEIVAALPIIICFQSLILDMAGNVGTQSLAVTIRFLADENATTGKKLALLWEELRIGMLNGAILGTLTFLMLGVYVHFFKGSVWRGAFAISGCVGAALLAAMTVSSLVGTLIPILFDRMQIDPAVASGPLITTVNDLVAVVTYYGLTYVFLIR